MKNKYGLPESELSKIRERDKYCVYCHKTMAEHTPEAPRKDWITIEHFNHLPPWNNHRTVGFCCWSCNSSRGNKLITAWFETAYCQTKGISAATVAKPVLEYIKEFEGYVD